MSSLLTEARCDFHTGLTDKHVLSLSKAGVASNADKKQKTSKTIAAHIAKQLNARTIPKKLAGQTAGNRFETVVHDFLDQVFPRLQAVRPGDWDVEHVGQRRKQYQIAKYEPYRHLDELANAVEDNRTLAAVLGNSYEIGPDIIVTRAPESDAVFNRDEFVVDDATGRRAVLRSLNQEHRIIHAVVSCKWTLRSDRAQNARSEALSVIRNRKGRAPHVVVVTGEPSPSRLASLALGTGDLDMVYHFALPELIAAVKAADNDEAESMLRTLLDGERLRDIADLPLDLAV